MTLEIVDPTATDIEFLASVDVKFSGGHIGGGIYFSANHNPGPGGSYTALPQAGLDGVGELHATTEIDFTLPVGGESWDDYRGDIDNNGTLDFVLAGFDISLQVGEALVSTGTFYDGPAVPLLIANDPNDLSGAVTITGYPSAPNSLNGLNGVLHVTSGTLAAGSYTDQTVNGDAGGYFTVVDATPVGGMSGGATYLDYDADGDGTTESYLIGSIARIGTAVLPDGTEVPISQAASFSPHYADMAAAIEGLSGDAARSADDFPRMVLLSAQSAGSSLTTVNGQFFHEDIYGGANRDTLYGAGGDDQLFGAKNRDRLFGGEGDDSLFGGQGSDRMTGGDGADLLDGGAGNDVLNGGAGADIFHFDANDKKDKIIDFTDGEDLLQFGDGITLDDISVKKQGKNAVIDYGSGQVLLKNVNVDLIDADDFLFL